MVSAQQEYLLGRSWLKAFRASVPEYDDPLVKDYLEILLLNLATYSELKDTQLELIIIDNPTMNAFAVPGGVIGIHIGLFNYAKSEDQLASVLAHELAHLSQRHFARGIEAKRKNASLGMGALLVGLVIAASGNPDAGTAVISASQAASLESSLRYSRSNEKEADRIGFQTIRNSGRDPAAVSQMFEQMLSVRRYIGNRPPEFLLTHPITEKRISDAKNRLLRVPKKYYPTSETYNLIRVRTMTRNNDSPTEKIKHFQHQLRNRYSDLEPIKYGLTLSLIQNGDYMEARKVINELITDDPDQFIFRYTSIELDIADQHFYKAKQKIEKLLTIRPTSYPLKLLNSKVLLKENRYERAAKVLKGLSRERPYDPHLWYHLAEVSGLAGDISGVHLARAEYFILVGAFDRAKQQFTHAAKLLRKNFKQSAIIQQRMQDLMMIEKRVSNL
ncbi:MAG: peptidase M48 [Cellvibrionales bacterium TMED49]|nr:peptidase M48 [Porticoccaceae bacterium]OUU37028.1 MAG: peptidase M48 [Cellvibrionales bacterium TMED49]